MLRPARFPSANSYRDGNTLQDTVHALDAGASPRRFKQSPMAKNGHLETQMWDWEAPSQSQRIVAQGKKEYEDWHTRKSKNSVSAEQHGNPTHIQGFTRICCERWTAGRCMVGGLRGSSDCSVCDAALAASTASPRISRSEAARDNGAPWQVVRVGSPAAAVAETDARHVAVCLMFTACAQQATSMDSVCPRSTPSGLAVGPECFRAALRR